MSQRRQVANLIPIISESINGDQIFGHRFKAGNVLTNDQLNGESDFLYGLVAISSMVPADCYGLFLPPTSSDFLTATRANRRFSLNRHCFFKFPNGFVGAIDFTKGVEIYDKQPLYLVLRNDENEERECLEVSSDPSASSQAILLHANESPNGLWCDAAYPWQLKVEFDLVTQELDNCFVKSIERLDSEPLESQRKLLTQIIFATAKSALHGKLSASSLAYQIECEIAKFISLWSSEINFTEVHNFSDPFNKLKSALACFSESREPWSDEKPGLLDNVECSNLDDRDILEIDIDDNFKRDLAGLPHNEFGSNAIRIQLPNNCSRYRLAFLPNSKAEKCSFAFWASNDPLGNHPDGATLSQLELVGNDYWSNWLVSQPFDCEMEYFNCVLDRNFPISPANKVAVAVYCFKEEHAN